MKRKRFDREGWIGIIRKRYYQSVIETDSFNGITGVIYFDDVSPPTSWGDVKVIDKGMKWLDIMPFDENYFITAMIDEKNHIVKWYIDIIAGYGACDDGVYWFDDLYLDVVVTPEGKIDVHDMDELEEALEIGDISSEQFSDAVAAKDKLLNSVVNNICEFERFCMDILKEAERRISL